MWMYPVCPVFSSIGSVWSACSVVGKFYPTNWLLLAGAYLAALLGCTWYGKLMQVCIKGMKLPWCGQSTGNGNTWSSVTLPGLAVPISVRGCFATCRRTDLSVSSGLRAGHSGGTRVLLLIKLEPCICDYIFLSAITPSTLLHAFTPTWIFLHTSASDFPSQMNLLCHSNASARDIVSSPLDLLQHWKGFGRCFAKLGKKLQIGSLLTTHSATTQTRQRVKHDL